MQDDSSQPITSNVEAAQPTEEVSFEDALWNTAGALLRWRRFIAFTTGLVAIAAVIISLILPEWYKSSTRLLLPEGGGSSLASAVLGDLGSVASSFLGGNVGGYTRYLALLYSRTFYESIVDEFDLIRVYELEEAEFPRTAAIELLAENLVYAVDEEYEFLAITAFDQNPQRAADIANYAVAELNRRHSLMTSETARNYRIYVEERYAASEASRDSLLNALQGFQAEYGVYDLPIQTEVFFSQVATLRAGVIQAEIQYEAMRAQLGDNNAQVQALANTVRAAQSKYNNALAGRERVMPVPQDTIPQVFRAYAEITMERLIQEKILELVAPLREQARFEELKQVEAVQVVDPAIVPDKKARPQRAIICIVATISGFILAVLFALVLDWWKRNAAYVTQRLQQATLGT